MCFNVFSLIYNLFFFDIADLILCISNYFFNIMYLSSLMLSSFFSFLSFELCFLMLIFDIQFVSMTTSSSLYSFLSKYLFTDFLVGNWHLFHQTFIILIVHHMFWYLFRSCIVIETIIGMHKLQKKLILNPKLLFIRLFYHKQLMTLF